MKKRRERIIRPTLKRIEARLRKLARAETRAKVGFMLAKQPGGGVNSTPVNYGPILKSIEKDRSRILKYLDSLGKLKVGRCSLPKKKQREMGLLPSVEGEGYLAASVPHRPKRRLPFGLRIASMIAGLSSH